MIKLVVHHFVAVKGENMSERDSRVPEWNRQEHMFILDGLNLEEKILVKYAV